MRAEILEAIENIPRDEQAALVATRMVAFSGPARGQHRSHRPDIRLRAFRSTRTRSSAVAFQRQLILSPDARCCKADVPAASNHFRKWPRLCEKALFAVIRAIRFPAILRGI
ncbi:hypothetical protein CQ13_35720 [Bradyrhizobium retamae]|uniref:Uncharacterized protein n=1 Tax=Bradyrhizobium retamae TaxID=1300035 RepID=A0A0R3MBV0_9BRAD|nr:hypothetical protein CQ13_35720 [Bradyrhizobium retamae]